MIREEKFIVENGYLVRQVTSRKGTFYEHRCPVDAFEQICHSIDELGSEGFILEEIVDYDRSCGRYVSFTNVAVTQAFLKDRGIVEVRYRRNYPTTNCVHLDAMTEFFAYEYNRDNLVEIPISQGKGGNFK